MDYRAKGGLCPVSWYADLPHRFVWFCADVLVHRWIECLCNRFGDGPLSARTHASLRRPGLIQEISVALYLGAYLLFVDRTLPVGSRVAGLFPGGRMLGSVALAHADLWPGSYLRCEGQELRCDVSAS